MDLSKRKKTRIVLMTAVMAAVILLAAGAAIAFSGEVGSVFEIEDAGMVVYGPGDGGYSNTKVTDLGDGLGKRYSYCIQPELDTPVVSSITVDKVLDSTASGHWGALRKTVYFSPSYPGYEDNEKDIRGAYYTGDFTKDWGIAHLAMSYIYAGRPEDLETYLGTKASDLGDIWTKAKKLGDVMSSTGTSWDSCVPASFKVFISRTAGYQGMAVGYLEPPGTVKIKKTCARQEITSGNTNYSLGGAVYTVFDKSSAPVKYVTLDGNGESGDVSLAPGTYTVTEKTAPKGYAVDKTGHKITIVSGSTYSLDVKDEPITAMIDLLLKKIPSGFEQEHGEGDAVLAGAVYSFSYLGKKEGTAAAGSGEADPAPLRTWYFVTDEKGEISGRDPKFAEGYDSDELYRNAGGEVVYPLGKYLVKEVMASDGYLPDESDLVFEVSEDGTGSVYTANVRTVRSEENIIRGGFRIAKTDAQLGGNVPQGDAVLSGAGFAVINRSEAEVEYGGQLISPGEKVMTVMTGEDGIAATAEDALPYGTYSVREETAPEGYLMNDQWEKTFSIRENGEIVDLTDEKVGENVKRSGLRLVKLDAELLRSEAVGGASLEGIVLTIRNISDNSVLVRTELSDSTLAVEWNDSKEIDRLLKEGKLKTAGPGEDVGKLTVRWNAEKKAYTAETLPDDLPYGTYSVRETETNGSYQRSDRSEHIIELREDGEMYSYDDGHEEILSFRNYVYRSDVKGTKIGDATSERLSFIPFRITSLTNGETHVVVTDRNGLFDTSDRRTEDELSETEEGGDERKLNPFDDLMDKKEITTAEIEEREKDIRMGVWFGTGEHGSKTEMRKGAGALPFDTYILEEMSCENNRGYVLQRFMFTVDEKSLNGKVDLETITDDVPEIETYAEVYGRKTDVKASGKTVLTDTVRYEGLTAGETYTVKGTLMDKSTGLPAKDPEGKEIVSQTEFKARRTKGKVKVEFRFNAEGLQGRSTVVFEKVYDSEGHLVASHEDIDDEGQTVSWRKRDKQTIPTDDTRKEIPLTGDTGGAGIWSALCASAFFLLFIVRRNEKKTRL